MEIATNLKDGTYHVTLNGKFTFSDHTEFRDILRKMEEDNLWQVILHLGGVDFVDSAALGMLLLADEEAKKRKKNLVISGATGQVKKMFDMAQFDKIFSMQA